MRWSELSADMAVWTVPAKRAKNGAAHVVHLAPEARALLEAIVNLFATNGPRLIRDAEQDLVADLVRIWTREGTRPGHHRAQQERIRRAWPALARAIEELVTRAHA